MKRNFFILSMSFIFAISLYAHGNTLTDHSQIKELSSFRIMGEIEICRFLILYKQRGVAVLVGKWCYRRRGDGKRKFLWQFAGTGIFVWRQGKAFPSSIKKLSYAEQQVTVAWNWPFTWWHKSFQFIYVCTKFVHCRNNAFFVVYSSFISFSYIFCSCNCFF